MKRTVFFALALLVLVAPSAFAQKTVKLVFTSVSVPGDAHTQAMTVFKDEVEKLSGGQIQVDIYHSGQLFTQQAEQDAIRKGTIDMVYSSAQWLAEFVPYLSMFGAAYTFQSYDQMTKTFNGPIGQKIFEEVAQKTGIRPLTAYYLGTRQLNVTAKFGPITKPEQMKNVKLRVPNSPTWIAMGKALGANPTPMAFGEVYMGLKTGAVDGQDNPLPTDRSAKFYEVTKYIILTDHVVDSHLAHNQREKVEEPDQGTAGLGPRRRQQRPRILRQDQPRQREEHPRLLQVAGAHRHRKPGQGGFRGLCQEFLPDRQQRHLEELGSRSL